MKEIIGKIKFGVIPISDLNIYDKQINFCSADDYNFLIKECSMDQLKEAKYCSEITEELAVELVNLETEWISNTPVEIKDEYIKIELPHIDVYQRSAKESLISLLKANGCWIKEWKEKPLHVFSDSPHEETSMQYQDHCKRIGYSDLPDDFLIIKL